jgi:hypothetical protein
MASLVASKAGVSTDRERAEEDDERKLLGGSYSSNSKEKCVLLTREGRPGELWGAI